ncbi:single Ig IL-1-related receptor [Brachionichthys hirsutus]|uniref:single Ig IL-1-related receptor n=1 Tax=Brachionichthys hirsutus TaxID=412623 RepID=UPI00360514A3
MAVFLVALILISVHWDKTFLAAAETCVDVSPFKEQVFYLGQHSPAYRLDCPLEPPQLLDAPRLNMNWLKGCQQLPDREGKAFLEFANLTLEDQGNYTCVLHQGNTTASFTVGLIVKEPRCSRAPEFRPDVAVSRLSRNVGSTVMLNCTALLLWDPAEEQCDTTLEWSKDAQPLTNHTLYKQNASSWSPVAGQLVVNSLLEVTLRGLGDFGLYSCTVRNASSDFSLQNSSDPSHAGAVVGAILLLFLLAVAALVYSRCHLNIKLWYRNSYGDFEFNDGKFFDAYISYVNNDHDRKFVNFILKPHLENIKAYKVHLNDNDILPGAEPSAELLMNMSRSRRLIILLSYAYLEQDWCFNSFRQGFNHLLEFAQRPIIIILLEGQSKRMRHQIKELFSQNQHGLTILTWKHNSVSPSSDFWKGLALAMPRRAVFQGESAGDPQTMLTDDKDPMLTLEPDYLGCHPDTDPAGDLGLRLPVYKALAGRTPVLPAAPVTTADPKPSYIDVSDLGSRNYGSRPDFYCLVTKEDM